MTKIEAEIHEDVVSILNKIKSINDSGIDLVLPEGSIIFDNIINLKILKKEVEEYGKTLHLITSDENGLSLIALSEGEVNREDILPLESTEMISETAPKKIKMPSVSMPSLNFSLPKKLPIKGAAIIAVVVLLLTGSGVVYALNAPKAYVKIVLETQPLTKSVAIKVQKDAANSSETKTLRGIGLEAEITQTMNIETTGEKLVGKKAKGRVKIRSYQDEDKVFKEGTVLKYDDLEFVLDENVKVPAQTVDLETALPTPGEAEVDVEAAQIGEEYNISKDKTLSIKGYKSNQYIAKATEDFEGGESKTIKVVAKEDITKLTEQVSTAAKDQAAATLTAKVGRGQKLVNGAMKITPLTQTFSAKEDEEAEKLELTGTYKVEGLVYASEDIKNLMDSLTTQLIPENFTLASKEKEISAEVLGNTDTTVLNINEADLQVTVKTFVVPTVDAEKLKDDLKGKKTPEAEKVLGSIRNVRTYELNIKPNIPLLSKIPNNIESIFVEVTSDD